MSDKVDIIMPNYNKGEFVGEAIQSVINQSYRNWKLYIIDDNSKLDLVSTKGVMLTDVNWVTYDRQPS